LNLARASGVGVPQQKLVFPRFLATTEEDYRPELELWRDELAELGVGGHQVVEWQERLSEPTYIYGRADVAANNLRIPYDGQRIDDKRNLAVFSHEWSGQRVHIPTHYENNYL
jgi:hypothetical protein